MRVRPFRGARPRPDLAGRIPSLPYDVLDSETARRLARGDPYTFLHVEKAEVDFPPGVSPYDERVYAAAGNNLRAMLGRGWLAFDPEPAFYVYRLAHPRGLQTGWIAPVSVEDLRRGAIRPHEQTRPEKVADRLRHARAIEAHASPVLLAHRGHERLEKIAEEVTREEPASEFEAADGVRHSVWVVSDPRQRREVERAFSEVEREYIADGHHRAAAYAELAEERKGGDGWQFLLAAHFPARELTILAYDRLVRTLDGIGLEELLAGIGRAGFDVEPLAEAERPSRPRTFALFARGGWYRLTARAGTVAGDDPARRLDVWLLTERILRPLLGIADPRTDPRLDFEGGSDLDVLEQRARSDGAALAFALQPVRIEEVMEVADRGGVLPPKSTWFEPKLRSGLVVYVPEAR